MTPQRFRLFTIDSLGARFDLKSIQSDPMTAGAYIPQIWGGADQLVRRNLLLNTATLATQNVTTLGLSYTLYLKGTGSVTLSGAATGTLNGTGAGNRVSLQFTATAGTLSLTVSGSVTEGHLTRTATADHSYQAITDWTTEVYDYNAQRQLPWLRRNRFVSTSTLATQTVSSVTASQLTVSFTGTGTITFSGAYSGSLVGTGASNRVQAAFTPAAGNLTCTVTGSVTNAQCENAAAATEYQDIGASWPATYTALAQAAGYPITLYSDRAGTIAVDSPETVVGKMLDLSTKGNHLVAPTDAARPLLKQDGNGNFFLRRDGVDDSLNVTLPNYGANCVHYRSTDKAVLKDQSITLNGATAFSIESVDYGRILLSGQSNNDAKIQKYLDSIAGRSSPAALGPELVTNGTFDSDTGWIKASGVTIGSGVADIANQSYSSGVYLVRQSVTVTSGKVYLFTYTYNGVAGSGAVGISAYLGAFGKTITNSGKYSDILVAASSGSVNVSIATIGGAGVRYGTLDDISVKEILL